jgi:membrane protein required for beta-lactamase induction
MAVSAKAEPHACPDCEPEEQTIAPILLLSLGGMLLFFSIGFGIVWWVADQFFMWSTLVLLTIGGGMMLVGYRIFRQNAKARKQRHMNDLARSKCSYCGGQNQENEQRCQFCGAPLF